MAERYGAEIDHARLASAADLRLNAATGGSMWLSLEPSDASRHQALYRKSKFQEDDDPCHVENAQERRASQLLRRGEWRSSWAKASCVLLARRLGPP